MDTRQIKFRAWEENGKNMISPAETGDHTINDLTEVMPYTLMQFTGLLDKNGKEIYEGDILKHDKDGTGEVVWNNKWAHYELHGDKVQIFPGARGDYSLDSRYEIIGNLYENPELIK